MLTRRPAAAGGATTFLALRLVLSRLTISPTAEARAGAKRGDGELAPEIQGVQPSQAYWLRCYEDFSSRGPKPNGRGPGPKPKSHFCLKSLWRAQPQFAQRNHSEFIKERACHRIGRAGQPGLVVRRVRFLR